MILNVHEKAGASTCLYVFKTNVCSNQKQITVFADTFEHSQFPLDPNLLEGYDTFEHSQFPLYPNLLEGIFS